MRLNQLLAREQTVKKDANGTRDSLYKALQKGGLFEGFTKTWDKLNEDSPDFPAEETHVQHKGRGFKIPCPCGVRVRLPPWVPTLNFTRS